MKISIDNDTWETTKTSENYISIVNDICSLIDLDCKVVIYEHPEGGEYHVLKTITSSEEFREWIS